MSLQYKLAQTDQGSYLFTTDLGLVYTIFFTFYTIDDLEGNSHTVYNFGFDRSGEYGVKKFGYKYDQRIKDTIVHVIKEFFQKNDDKALLYFCYSGDEYSRHRSIIFSKWCREELSDDIEHMKKTTIFEEEKLHGGMLILKSNPLRHLLIDAVSKYIDDAYNLK